MIRVLQNKLIIPRGDTGTFSVPVLTSFHEGDTAIFSIIDAKTNKNILQKECVHENEALTVEFTHYDTVNVQPGRYYWDIKIYRNAEFVDEQLVNGEEVDSYYAAYRLPVCEVRQTGDKFITDENEEALSNEALNVLNSTLNKVTNIGNEMEAVDTHLTTVDTRLAALETHFPEASKLSLGDEDAPIVMDVYEQYMKVLFLPPFHIIKSMNSYLPQLSIDDQGRNTLSFRGRYRLIDSKGTFIDDYNTQIVNNSYTKHSYHLSNLNPRTIEDDDYWNHVLTIYWDIAENVRHPIKFALPSQATNTMFPIGWWDNIACVGDFGGLPLNDTRNQG